VRFITASVLDVVCTLKPIRAYMTDPLKFHLEVRNMETGEEAIVNNPVVVPATSTTNGSVTFSAVPFTNPGLFLVRLQYATQVDLDGNAVSLTTVMQDTVNKIVPQTSLTF